MQAEKDLIDLKVLLCLHCWGITTIRCPSMLAYGLANNNLVYTASTACFQQRHMDSCTHCAYLYIFFNYSLGMQFVAL